MPKLSEIPQWLRDRDAMLVVKDHKDGTATVRIESPKGSLGTRGRARKVDELADYVMMKYDEKHG